MSLLKKIIKVFRREIRDAAVLEFESALSIRVFDKDGKLKEDRGVVGRKSITNAGVNYLVDGFQNSTTSPISDFKYHASGTSSTAENVADTTLGTEVEASRTTGSQTEGASTNIYRSVGTITYTATRAIVEHGLFSAATSGTLWDRTVFSAVNVVSSDSIEFTYEVTCSAGG